MIRVIRLEEIVGEVRGPGVTRKITVDKAAGSGAIATGVVYLEPGGLIPPHTHLVEEAMTLVEGTLKILVGTETTEVAAGASWFAPANTVHGARNVGQSRATLMIAYPANEVAAFRVEVEF